MMGEDDDAAEPLDPRVQNELERLNKASLLINRLENDLDDARAKFRSLLSESTKKLDNQCKRLGSCIEKSKPYYDSRLKATEVQVQTVQAASKYERAMGMQTAAREMVELAEQGYESKRPSFDTAWQEMLNHATKKVMDAENERILSEVEHQRMAQLYAQVQVEVNEKYKENKRAIVKSKSYYEMKANFHTSLENQKVSIEKLQKDTESAKKLYSKALSNLESISEEIHTKRRTLAASVKLGKREAGVGSESPVPPPVDHKRHTFNNNITGETEIIISFPPVVPNTKDITLPNAINETVNGNTPDQPINISGVRISSISSHENTPTIIIDSATTDISSTNQLPDDLHLAKQEPENAAASSKQIDELATARRVSSEISSTNQKSSEISLTNRKSSEISSTNRKSSEISSTNRESDGVTFYTADQLKADQMKVEQWNGTTGNHVTDLSKEANDHSVSSSLESSPVSMRHKRGLSGSIKLSAKRLLQESSSIDSDSGSVNSFVAMDDNGVVSAMADDYFHGTYEEELRKSVHEDYSVLPQSLAVYQKPYESARKSLTSFPQLNEAELKLDQVLKLLEITDDESVV